MYVSVCISAVPTKARRGRQTPELELRVVVWVLGTELRSSQEQQALQPLCSLSSPTSFSEGRVFEYIYQGVAKDSG